MGSATSPVKDRFNELAQWVSRYADTFGFGDRQKDTLGQWIANLNDTDFTMTELNETFDRICVKRTNPVGPTAFLSEHYNTIITVTHGVRRENRAAEIAAKAPPRDAPCPWCHAVGLVEVPHPRFVSGGEWHDVPYSLASRVRTFYVTVVCCRCPLGKWLHEKHGGVFGTIDHYEKNVTMRWPELLAEKWASIAADLQRRRAEDEADRPRRDAAADRPGLSRPVPQPVDMKVLADRKVAAATNTPPARKEEPPQPAAKPKFDGKVPF